MVRLVSSCQHLSTFVSSCHSLPGCQQRMSSLYSVSACHLCQGKPTTCQDSLSSTRKAATTATMAHVTLKSTLATQARMLNWQRAGQGSTSILGWIACCGSFAPCSLTGLSHSWTALTTSCPLCLVCRLVQAVDDTGAWTTTSKLTDGDLANSSTTCAEYRGTQEQPAVYQVTDRW